MRRAPLLAVVMLSVPLAAPAQHGQTAQSPPAPGNADAYAADVLRMAQRTVLPLRSCARDTNRAYPGTLAHAQQFTLTVRPDGSVENIDIAPDDGVTARLRSCLVPVVRRWTLHAPTARITLSYTMARLREAFGAYHF